MMMKISIKSIRKSKEIFKMNNKLLMNGKMRIKTVMEQSLKRRLMV
jgi:hypothetical protein